LTLGPKLASVLDARTPTRYSLPACCVSAVRGAASNASVSPHRNARQSISLRSLDDLVGAKQNRLEHRESRGLPIRALLLDPITELSSKQDDVRSLPPKRTIEGFGVVPDIRDQDTASPTSKVILYTLD
jgi:hypothetical protein